MNTTLKTVALVCATLFVTACGSSGEEGPSVAATNTTGAANTANTANTSNTSNTTNTTNTSNTSNTSNTATPAQPATPTAPATPAQPSTPTQPATPAQPTTPTQQSGGNKVGTAVFGRSTAYVEPTTKINAANFDSITIDGRQITLTDKGTVGSTHTSITDTDNGRLRTTMASGSNFSYMRFGSTLWTNSSESKQYHYAFGDVTPTSGANAVPTSGKAAYKGFATGMVYAPVIEGEANFDVDFGKKTISGVITSTHTSLNLAGTINGASFSGKKDAVSMEGHFFGPNAAELGGVYKVDRGLQGGFAGAFGAKKQ